MPKKSPEIRGLPVVVAREGIDDGGVIRNKKECREYKYIFCPLWSKMTFDFIFM